MNAHNSQHQSRRNLTLAVFAVSWILFALFTHSHANSWNDISRLATVESLVHRGTWYIEGTILGERTGDRVFLNGHFYSDKPPVFSGLAAGGYALLHRVFGLSLQPPKCDPGNSPCYCFALLCPGTPDWAYYWLTVFFVGLPAGLMLALFYHTTAFWGLPEYGALLLTLVLAIGTLVFPYSVVFSNHVPAAASLLLGFYAWLRARNMEGRQSWWLALSGFAFALSLTFDLWTGTFLAVFGLYAVWRFRQNIWPFVLGASLPLAVMAGLDWMLFGDPLPPQLHPEGFNYPGSPFAATVTGTQRAGDVLDYAFRMLVGDHGIFAFVPVLLWAVWATFHSLSRRGHKFRAEAWLVFLSCLGQVLYFAFFTDNFGGVAYGPRWVIGMIPLLFFFAAQPELYQGWQRRLGLGMLAVLSIASVWPGVLDPWKAASPLLRLETAVSPVSRYLQSSPELSQAVVYTSPPAIKRWPLVPRPYWQKRAREFDISSGLLPLGEPERALVYVVNAGDLGTANILEQALPEGKWGLIVDDWAVYTLKPDSGRGMLSEPTVVDFSGQIQLVGYELPGETLQPGDVLTVRLAWKVLAPVAHSYTAFVHLLGEEPNPDTGTALWAQDDHLPGYTSRPTYATDQWSPGEIIWDQFQLTLPEEIPAGRYTLTTGFYELETLQRLPLSAGAGDTAKLTVVVVR